MTGAYLLLALLAFSYYSSLIIWCDYIFIRFEFFSSIGRINPQLYSLGAGSFLSQGVQLEVHENYSNLMRWMQHYVNGLCINAWQVYGFSPTPTIMTIIVSIFVRLSLESYIDGYCLGPAKTCKRCLIWQFPSEA